MALRAASTALLALALMTGAAGALAATLTGSGRSVTEDRPIAGYTGIALSIPGRVEGVRGATEGIRITLAGRAEALDASIAGSVRRLGAAPR
jgi:hypothetical protein